MTEKDGKFNWKCKKSWLEVSCSATKREPDKATCWSSDGKTLESKPTSNLCVDWNASAVIESKSNKKWTWTCTKWNDVKSCESYMDEPACGTANGTTRETAPSTNAEKCADWNASTVTEKDWKFNWKCSKSWLEVSCSATKKEPDKAVCWTADKKTREKAPSTNTEKCADWNASAITESKANKKWIWTCTKWNDVKSCEAYMDEPECWTANGTTREKAPSTNAEMCSDGTASVVTEKDWKFNWSCKKSWLEVQCSATKKDEELPYVEIEKKELLGDKEYNVGDKVAFKVYFRNKTTKNIENVLIRDFFPLNLKLPEVSISVKWANFLQYKKEGNNIIEFSWFSLKSWDSWYIVLTWEITDEFMLNTENCAFSYRKAWERAVTSKCADPYSIKKNIKVEKKVVSSAKKVSNWDVIDYEVKITSYGWVYSWLVIKDDLPDGVTYVANSYSVKWPSEIVLNEFKNGDPLIWTISIPNFKKWQEIIVKYSVRVNQNSEESSYKNKVCALDLNQSELWCDTFIIVKDSGALDVNKYISSSYKGEWKKSLTLSASDEKPIVYFKIEIKWKSWKLQQFDIEDTYDQNTFEIVKEANGIEKYYIDEITNKSDEEYKYVSEGTFENWKITWNVKMEKWNFSKNNVYSIIFPMKLKAMEWWNIACVVNPSACSEEAKFVIEKDPIPDCIQEHSCPEPVCWDWIQEAFEHCDWWGEVHEIWKDGKLFRDKGIYNAAYAWLTCSSDCHLNLDPSCFNVQNWWISIMTWEMLPFYWNVEWMLWNQTESARRDYLQRHFYSSEEVWWDCNENNVYKIDLATLKCDFLIYWPSIWWNKDIIYELNGIDCVKVNWWWENGSESEYYPAIKHYIDQNWNWWFAGSISSFAWSDKVKNVFESLNNWQKYPTLFPVSSKVIINNFGSMWGSFVSGIGKTVYPKHEINTFWEYKVSLNSISYSYCDYHQSEEWKNHFYMTDWSNDRVCEVDFAVTNHYLVQKSPFGYVDQETAKNLNSYYLKNGEPLFTFEDEDKKVDNYQIMADVSDNFDTFIQAHSRNAKMNSSLNLRQVNWYDIYLTDLEPGEIFDVPTSLLTSSKPFTLIASKWADIRIKGNAIQNMMIITQWKIIFDAADACNAQREWTAKYSKAGQLVQWIFYAWSWYDSVNDKLNTSVYNDYWCNYGNIHIKWVVLWDLTNVKNKRRSELYTWFSEDWYKVSDKKREIVLNWASVMVEFNSSLLSSDIPWVAEFNKMLDIKRK